MKHILQRIDSRHLAKLWLFYRNYFPDDASCLDFLYTSLKNEPANDGAVYHEPKTGNKTFTSNQGTTISDSAFIPRRMLNAVERLVTAARDMEQIRRGKDIFKIVYLVACLCNNIDGYPTRLILNIDLEHYSRKNKREHCFQSTLSYKDFEDIFVRTCIEFIGRYVKERNMHQASDE